MSPKSTVEILEAANVNLSPATKICASCGKISSAYKFTEHLIEEGFIFRLSKVEVREWEDRHYRHLYNVYEYDGYYYYFYEAGIIDDDIPLN